MIRIGEINKLKVNRETDIGFMLEDGTEEMIFLHKNESNYEKLKKGDLVSAFLYFDQKGRLAATLKSPKITVASPNFLRATDVLHNLGVFFDMGINKEVLLSKDDLPLDKNLWPKTGDTVYLKLVVKSKLVVKISPITYDENIHELDLGSEKEFIVERIGHEGLNLISEDLTPIFVHKSQFRDNYRIGQTVLVKILNKSEKGYTGSLIKQKELLRYDDGEVILNYLDKFKKMPLNSKSSAEEISNIFKHLSRKAFKRALGLLYKERKIDFVDDETILINGDKNER